nr:zeatin O-glucosyltransferase-like [Ipomoea batatas]
METGGDDVAVVMVPFPAQGHLNQLLNLILRPPSSLHFDCPSPNPNASVRFPAHLQPAFDASQLLRRPIAGVLRHLAAKARRVVIIHDVLMALVVQDVESISNAESYAFNCVSIFYFLPFCMEAEPVLNTDWFDDRAGPMIEGAHPYTIE